MADRGRGRRPGAVALAVVVIVVPAAAFAVVAAIDDPATVDTQAVRGEASQVTPTVPPPPGCRRVIVIGDSLMDNAEPWLRAGLRDAGFTYFVDAEPSRRIPERVRAPKSGVKAARSVRATWGEADCWMIALGSNDLIFGGGDPATADSMIDEMLGATTPDARVWWVNVDYHRDSRTSFDFPRATAVFNERLDARAAADPAFTVIDWYSYAEANLNWFFDPVHVDRTGSIARAEQAVAALPRSGP
ncbi:MAG: hypothetical protein QNJ12_18260 [Ilumatobacter sp.]|uniref:hypothetical protein n=1 Tax=Ilumatobacter sp. TaxID=1967498 RepID=UPI0026101AA9|nr:hypothetical protein [Ilumatobacter sp.]MDJ0770743.1 hypothetical protein [Ilumatobacter sp.]